MKRTILIVLSFAIPILFAFIMSILTINLDLEFIEYAVFLFVPIGYIATIVSIRLLYKNSPFKIGVNLIFISILFAPPLCTYLFERVFCRAQMLQHLISGFLLLFYSIPFAIIAIIVILVMKFSKKDDED